MDVSVKFGKEKLEIRISSTEITVGEIKNLAIQRWKEYSIDEIRLIFGGRVLENQSPLSTLKIDKNNLKFTMLASKPVKIDIKNLPRIKDDFSKPIVVKKQRKMNLSLSVESRFSEIQTLPLPMESRAREILTELANEPGIVAVMKKHNWRVGALAELYPEGQVGVDPVTILGLNENAGMRILLRIRSDCLEGFRDLNAIRKVLCHELAHNVYQEHDDDFYRLWRQIEKEVFAMDWRNSAANRLEGKQKTDRYDDGSSGDYYIVQSSSASNVTGGVYRLGDGDASDESVSATASLRELSARAAMQRRSRLELEMVARCGCAEGASAAEDEGIEAANQSDAAAAAKSAAVKILMAKQAETAAGLLHPPSSLFYVSESKDESNDGLLCLPCSSSVVDDNTAEFDAVEDASTSLETAQVIQSLPQANWVAVSDAVMAVIDEGIASSLAVDGMAPIESLFRLREAFASALAYCPADAANSFDDSYIRQTCIDALILLRTIVGNAKEIAERRELNANSNVFKRLIAENTGAMEILHVAGFDEPDNIAYKMKLKRVDMALLYIVYEMLDSCIHAVDTHLYA